MGWRATTLIALTLTAPLAAEEAWRQIAPGGFNVEATLSANTISLTDEIKVTLAVTIPTGYTIDANALKQHLMGEGEIPDNAFRLVSQKTAQEGPITILTFVLDPQRPGKHYLTFQDINFRASSTNHPPVDLLSGVFTVDVAAADLNTPLRVAGVLPLEAKPILDLDPLNQRYLIQQAQEEPQNNRRALMDRSFPWHYIVIYPLALAALYGLFKLVLMGLKALIKPKPTPSPTERATLELQNLEASDLLATGDFNSFYTQLTNTLRNYLEGHYGMRAPDMTTEEFMAHLSKEASFDPATRQQLGELMSYADRVKFAREPSTPENCMTAVAYAKQLLLLGQSDQKDASLHINH